MIYLFETEITVKKPIFISLRQIYGIGKFRALLICKHSGFSKNLKLQKLTEKQISKLVRIIEFVKSLKDSNFEIASDLKKTNLLRFKNLISIKSYKGLRKNQGLPVRGQRTHTNSRTSKTLRSKSTKKNKK